MRNIIIILLALVMNSALAATDLPTPDKLSLNVSLNYKQRDPNGSFNEYLIKDTLNTEVGNHQWLTIQNMTESSVDQFLLLGRIESADAQSITMKFLVLDTGSKPGVVSAPTIVVKYGQKGQLTLNEDNQKIHLTIVASAK